MVFARLVASPLFVAALWTLEAPAQTEGTCLEHPEHLSVPSDLLSVTVTTNWKTGIQSVGFPQAAYTIGHYDGWQECLFRFACLDIDVTKDFLGAFGFEVAEPWTERGLESGFLVCSIQIARLLERKPLADVKELARKALRQRHAISWNFTRHRQERSKWYAEHGPPNERQTQREELGLQTP